MWMLYAIVVVLILIADQLVKYWVTANITLNTGSIELIPGILKLINIHNDGAAFSLFPGWRWIFVGLAAAVTIAVILALAFKWIKGGFGRWMAVLTMAGALGNAIDRAIYGYVVDMFVIEPVKFIQVFNVADIFITVGGILFCLYLIFSGGKQWEKKPKTDIPADKESTTEENSDSEVQETEAVSVSEIDSAEETEDAPVPQEEDVADAPELEDVNEDSEEELAEVEETEDASAQPESSESEEEPSVEEEEDEEVTSEEYTLFDEMDEAAEHTAEDAEEAVPEDDPLLDENAVESEDLESTEPAAESEPEEIDEQVNAPEEDLPEEDILEEGSAVEDSLDEENPAVIEEAIDSEDRPEEALPETPVSEPVLSPAPQAQEEPEEEFSFDLEDILNEFR